MRKPVAYVLFVTSLVTGVISFAQNSVLAGKIVDENGKPVSGAIIKMTGDGVVLGEAKSDSDGLYCSRLLPCGRLPVSVFLNGKMAGKKWVVLNEKTGSKEFFIIKVMPKKIIINKVDNDPALAVKLSRIEEQQKMMDYPAGKMHIMKRDTSAIYRSREKAPK